MFVNFSNHPHEKWSNAQLQAAKELGGGEVVTIKFPDVPPHASTTEVAAMADKVLETEMEPDRRLMRDLLDGTAVWMVQGEFSLSFNLTQKLLLNGVRCVVACSERKTIEEQQPDGSTKKTAVFEFACFRDVATIS